MRFGIVGTGTISDRHAAAILSLADRAELAAVVSRDIGRAEAWGRRHAARPFIGVADAVRTCGIDAIVVCTETGMHAQHAIEAMRAGAHVLIEKPADITVARIDEVIAVRDELGATAGVVSQHRFDAATERTLEALRSQRLGTITSAVASLSLWRDQAYYDSGGWRGTHGLDGGGALMNQGIHLVDLLLAAMGPAVEVFGRTATRAHERIEVEDVAVATVRFASGALAVIHASTAAHPGGEVLLRVHGDRGTAVIRDDRLEWLGVEAVADDGGEDDSLERQYLDLISAVHERRQPRVALEDSRAAVALITAVYESASASIPIRL